MRPETGCLPFAGVFGFRNNHLHAEKHVPWCWGNCWQIVLMERTLYEFQPFKDCSHIFGDKLRTFQVICPQTGLAVRAQRDYVATPWCVHPLSTVNTVVWLFFQGRLFVQDGKFVNTGQRVPPFREIPLFDRPSENIIVGLRHRYRCEPKKRSKYPYDMQVVCMLRHLKQPVGGSKRYWIIGVWGAVIGTGTTETFFAGAGLCRH